MSQQCLSYMKMLLATGFHKDSDPKIFQSDIENIGIVCKPNELILTNQFIKSPSFNMRRFHDLEKLRMVISQDIMLNNVTWTHKWHWF